MTRQELEQWLCGDGTLLPGAAEVAALLGVTREVMVAAAPHATARRLARGRFAIAVLRDVFADDHAVHCWLRTSRPELGGRSGRDLLWAGETRAVEDLAVREWHRPDRAALLAASYLRIARSA
ncbi:MAG: hypothetical protein ACXW61_04785 [Gemmatirosa sp.]